MKKKLSIIALASMSLFSLAGVVLGTVSWFVANNQTPKELNIKGQSAGAYFAYGDGLPYEVDGEGKVIHRPYGISVPRHLYNLSWLQYMGQFDDGQYYFEIADNVSDDGLDMTGYVLPPIGTEEKPFVGNFNGKGKIIKNLTVTNDENELFNSQKHPDQTQVTYEAPEIVGLFGVVGNYNDAYEGTYETSVNSIHDLGISNISVQTTTNKALVGIAAGYVDATISNVAVNESTINVETANTAAVDATNLTANLSDYGVVGYATDDYKKSIKTIDQELYDIEIGPNAQFNATDDGNDQGWGGSINMTDLYNRLLKFKSGGFGSTTGTYYYSRTWTYNPDKTSYTESGGKSNSDAFKYYNTDPKVGVYQIGNRASTDRFMYLNGGQYVTKQYKEYRTHTGIVIKYGSTDNKLTVNSFSNNSGTIGNTTGNSPALWSVPNTSGYISTQYYYNDANTPTTYYLYNNNGTLGLTTSTSTRTTWYKTTNSSGAIRYSTSNSTTSGYYLDFSGTTWMLTEFPTAPTVPTAPTEPTEPTEPNYSSYLSNGYQIYYVDGETTYYFATNGTSDTSHATDLSPSTTYGWKFEVNGSDVTIDNATNNICVYTTINNTKYYIKDGSNNPYRYVLVTNRNNATKFTKQTSGTNYILKNSSGNYYLSYDSNTHNYEDRSSQSGLYNTLVIKTTQSILREKYEAELETYQEAYQQYQKDYAQYESDLQTYDQRVEEYNTAISNSFKLSQEERNAQNPVIGPETYIDNNQTVSGMEYGPDNTTYFPLNVVADGSQTNITNYYPKESNTGYVTVGSRYDASYTWADDDNTYYRRSNMRVSEYPISNISSSYTPDGGFSHIYTLDQSNNVTEITNPSSYQRYSDSLEQLGGILSKNSSNVYGMHFMDSEISSSALVEAKYALINGTEYTNYQLPVNSIDFNLKEKGYINLFAGMYFSDNDSLFSLHQVIRNSDTTISAIKEIKEVYSDGVSNHSIIYKYTDNKYSAGYSFTSTTKTPLTPGVDVNDVDLTTLQSGYNLVFKTTQITNFNHDTDTIINSDFNDTNYGKNIFYFEIPMNSGEFCLGSVKNGVGGYLFYLDIGANAAKTQRTSVYEHYKEIKKVFEYPAGVAVVAVTTVADNLANNTQLDETNTANFLIYASNASEGTVKVSRSGNDVTLARTGGLLTSAKPTLVGELMWDSSHQQYNIHKPSDEGSTNLTNEIISIDTTTEVMRLQYYDWNVNLNELTVTHIIDTSTDGGTTWERSFYQEYADGTSTTNFSDMKIYNTSNGVKYMSESDIASVSTHLGSGANDTLIFKITYQEDDGENVVYNWALGLTVDSNATGKYYIFQDYVFEATLESGSVTLKVVSKGSKTIKINSTTITEVGQTVTITPAP